jgi:pilus assembly protein Flp/PilA
MAFSQDRKPVARRSTALRRFLGDAGGGTAMEYAMIGALIFAVAAGTIRLYGSRMNDVYARIGSAAAQIN